jgi:hypothetical protein
LLWRESFQHRAGIRHPAEQVSITFGDALCVPSGSAVADQRERPHDDQISAATWLGVNQVVVSETRRLAGPPSIRKTVLIAR